MTGERDSQLAASATALAARVKAITDVPVLVGVGVSDAEQAYEASRIADGVIQGASVVRRLMEEGPDSVGNYVAEVRSVDRSRRRPESDARRTRNEGRVRPSSAIHHHSVSSARCPPRAAICALPPG